MVESLRPLDDQVVIRQIEESVTKGGIMLPDQADKRQQRGIVEARGPGRILHHDGSRLPWQVDIGDEVVIARGSGQRVKVNGEDRLLVREHEILAVVQHDDKSNGRKRNAVLMEQR